MAKNTALTSDVDFIKEFEELKLKQKLPIDSLNKKNISQQNQLFMEINSKLDFLVKIFKEANDTDSKVEDEKLESHFKLISDKLDLIEKGVNEKFEKNEKIFSEIQTELENINTKLLTPSVISNNSQASPPIPGFEVKDNVQLISPSSGNVEEKKKGWFK